MSAGVMSFRRTHRVTVRREQRRYAQSSAVVMSAWVSKGAGVIWGLTLGRSAPRNPLQRPAR